MSSQHTVIYKLCRAKSSTCYLCSDLIQQDSLADFIILQQMLQRKIRLNISCASWEVTSSLLNVAAQKTNEAYKKMHLAVQNCHLTLQLFIRTL